MQSIYLQFLELMDCKIYVCIENRLLLLFQLLEYNLIDFDFEL
jgi:hypothetical protein